MTHPHNNSHTAHWAHLSLTPGPYSTSNFYRSSSLRLLARLQRKASFYISPSERQIKMERMNQHRRRDCNDNVIIVFLVSALIAAVALPISPVGAFLPSSSSSSSSTATTKKSSTRVPWMTTATTTSTVAYFQSPYRPSSTSSSSSSSSTELSMVFDFFKERSSEGIAQLSKLSNAASKGKIGEGLAEAASYTKVTNEAFADGLAKSRNRFLNNFDGLFGGSTATTQDELLEELQDVLLQADLGVATSDDIVNEVRSLALDTEEDGEAAAAGGKKNKEIVSREDLMSIMRGVLIETLDFEKKEQSLTTGSTTTPATTTSTEDDDSEDNNDNITTTIAGASAIRFASKEDNIPTVLFVMGANGMGKTTTIGKLANRLRVEGNQKVLVAACDTFRAGAVEQLQMWADKAQVDLIGPSEKGGSTPTSIIGDALDKAKAENYDTVLVDTAGRLSNNWELNEELVRMKEMIQEKLSADPDNKLNPDVPHEILLVLDAAQGRMALDSARVWNKELGLTGLILTKLDGSARGGSVVAISRDLNVPVKLIGVGEGIDDLKDVRISYTVYTYMILMVVVIWTDKKELFADYRLYYLCVSVLLSDTLLKYSFYHLCCCRCRC